MPLYKKDVSTKITTTEAEEMIARLTKPRDQALVACLYLTGARPCELRKSFEDKNGKVVNRFLGKHFTPYLLDKDYFGLELYTAKRSKQTGYNPERRRLEIRRDAPTAKYLLDWLVTINDEQDVFGIGTIRIRQIVWLASDNKRPPYAMRHNRIQALADPPNDASPSELMAWKGASDLRSVSPYLANKPIGRKLEIK